ncbi:S8 family peptidase [Anaerosporobacter sp.]|uniref:S8 family peptidase n=1 Tax=Anaerosporobacter sp. TaxID=1872529 RepID=UPI00289F5928|nr:S8 family peptidase [Anaerosporobacter sp.]
MLEILDENYYDQIIDNVLVPLYDMGNNITYINDRHSLLHILVNQPNPCDLGINPYHRFPSLFTLESTESLEKSNIRSVQRNPNFALYGQGVVVGVIDTGIDYTHPAFRNTDGSTRILSIWDQTIQSGAVPEGFTFGTEYGREQINLALQSTEPLSIVPTVDTNGHGTAIASILAGTQDTTNDFSGVVPEADMVVIKLKEAKQNLKQIFCVPVDAICYQESDIMLGVRYALSVALKLNKPLAICIALGSSQGGHDGRGALSSYIGYLSQLPRTGVAVGGGNEGNTRRHYYGIMTTDIQYKEFELNVDGKDTMFSMEIWVDTPGRFAISITAPTGETTQLIYPKLGVCNEYTFIFTETRIWVNNILFEEESGDPLILIRFRNIMQGIWHFRVLSIDKENTSFNVWLPSENLISRDTYLLEPDPNITITSPGNGVFQLTVAAYNQNNNSIMQESSRGYNRLGEIQPNVAAPGYQLTCAVPGNGYGALTGTGGAAAHTAGVIAMILEWAVTRGNYGTITGNNINHLIIRGAYREVDLIYPNNVWGYGKVNVSGIFERLTV